MSPRSAEFFEAAQRRLETARRALDSDPASALSLAYYAMLYAARAALSERDQYAKTHAGTWYQFRETFVEDVTFDAELVSQAQAIQPKRERADYEAWLTPEQEAREAVELAAEFLSAVAALLAELDG